MIINELIIENNLVVLDLQLSFTTHQPILLCFLCPLDFFGNSQHIFYFLSLSGISLLFLCSSLFISFPALVQIKDSTAFSHSTSVTIMCEVHGHVSKTFLKEKKKKDIKT